MSAASLLSSEAKCKTPELLSYHSCPPSEKLLAVPSSSMAGSELLSVTPVTLIDGELSLDTCSKVLGVVVPIPKFSLVQVDL